MLHPELLRMIDTTAPYAYRTQCSFTSVSADTTSAPGTIIIQDRPFICTRARVSGFYFDGTDAKRIAPSSDDVDITRILLRLSGGQRDLMQEPIDIHAFNEMHGEDTFAGILFPTKTEIIVTISNEIMTASHYQLPVKFDIALFGYHSLIKK